ncbi:peptidase M23 [Neobacillus sp. MER 74]|uniref:peptidase M23 n=1 Tax=Neobacillus sp. MER 74 TaxID=2939566 RepID=UPI00203E2100|nr:peptidase M23 [Neobacillus sp. MER 74]MCM3115466.1 peptidase M23 [Neobacillus sp. MER 74]
MISELIDKTNKQMSDIDEIILQNANSTLKLIDMQLQILNDLEEQTDDKQLLKQLDKQMQQLKNNRVLFVLMNKYIVSNELNNQEKRVLMKIFKRM